MLGFHHCGTFLLFVSFILLLVSTLTAPVGNNLSLLTIKFGPSPDRKVTLGVLGACIVRDVGPDSCSPAHVGYNPSDYIRDGLPPFLFRGSNIGDVSTSALVLHPIATGLAFLAFLIAAISHRIGFLWAAFMACLTWVVVLVVVVIDITTFYHVRQQANDLATLSATYGAGFCTMVAFILLFFAGSATCSSCVSARRRTKDV
ncbi:hypothetical protein JCM1841_002266 [Sporobolomyces salmonicolor]